MVVAPTEQATDAARPRATLLRNHGGGHAPVSNLELFFDLVFVFAITQLSQTLHHHLTWRGLAEGVVLFLAVWWAWIYTTWVTNWANPDRVQMRVLLLALMLLSLTMAAALPGAFADRAGVFAASYLAIQLGRSAAMAVLFRREGADRVRNMVRITAWFAVSAPLWIGGAMAAEPARLRWWLGALAIEYAGPMAMFRTPGMGRSLATDWDISGSHMAERCALFIIIALGEGIVVSGTAFAGQAIDSARAGGFVLAFLSAALMWWLYFDLGAERGARLISGHDQAGRVARNAYTYLHMPIVLGVVIGAVGDALLLDQASAPASHAFVLLQTGGAVLFLTGLGLFKRVANTLGNFPMSHGVAVGLFAILALATWNAPPAADHFTALCVTILALTCLWEWVSYHGGWMERMEAIGLPIPAGLKARAELRRAAQANKP
ncbi:MAG: hypothetical protein RLZZ427_1185 [Pseudomonadota bacterium]